MSHPPCRSIGARLVLLATVVAAGSGIIACAGDRAPTAPIQANAPSSLSADVRGKTFTTILYPGSFASAALSISADGVILGRYQRVKGETHGFMRSEAGEYTTIDVPGASFTAATGFNSRGDIVGQYSLPTDPKGTRQGFVLSDGVFTSINVPGATFTNVLGINDRGDIVGRSCTSTTTPCLNLLGLGYFHGFLLRDGAYTTIDVPSATETDPWKIGPNGEIVGVYRGMGGRTHLFRLRHNVFTTVDLPGVKSILFENGGINTRGDIGATYCTVAQCDLTTANHGFLLSEDKFVQIDFPGAVGTSVFGTNARRDVVGFYLDAKGNVRGFLLAGR